MLENLKKIFITAIFAIFCLVVVDRIQIFAQPGVDKNYSDAAVKTIREKNDVPLKSPTGQTSDNIKIIESGILNDQAIYLSQPVYPATAKAANAKGVVNVEVLINAKGIVVKAKAVSGNALLRNTAEWAARRTKFKPAKTGENPVLVKGIIVY
jgi:TonB family protein